MDDCLDGDTPALAEWIEGDPPALELRQEVRRGGRRLLGRVKESGGIREGKEGNTIIKFLLNNKNGAGARGRQRNRRE